MFLVFVGVVILFLLLSRPLGLPLIMMRLIPILIHLVASGVGRSDGDIRQLQLLIVEVEMVRWLQSGEAYKTNKRS